MQSYEKLVIVTRRTRLDELIDRFNTKGQAKFYIEHAGGDFSDYEQEHETYQRALERLRRELDFGLPRQIVERALVSTYSFSARDLVVALGQDGLVANLAKYAGDQPIIGVNPDPQRFDGVLLPFLPEDARAAAARVLEGKAFPSRAVTLAAFTLDDGQELVAFNDLFVGTRTHTSARYRLTIRGASESQSSSGILISTGAGSTGWMSSVFNMASGVTTFAGGKRARSIQFPWEDPRLMFAVREPFVSRHSAASLVAGWVESDDALVVESLMPSGGVVFSDGIEADYLEFNAGAVGRARRARRRAVLVVAGR